MSRGLWEYKDEFLQSEIFGCDAGANHVPNVFEDKEISEIIFDVFQLLYAFDSYKCGDWSKESWLGAKSRFKEKWFGQTENERVKRIVESTLADAKKEIFKTFGVN